MCCCYITTEVLLAYIFTYTNEIEYNAKDIYSFLNFLKECFFTHVISDLDMEQLKIICTNNIIYDFIKKENGDIFIYKLGNPNINYINDSNYTREISEYIKNLTKLWYDKWRKNELD